jgi:hypothetical protein
MGLDILYGIRTKYYKKMVKIINTNLPKEFNEKIIIELSGSHLWRIATDEEKGAIDIVKKDTSDSGFSFTTYRENEISNTGGFWNSLAEIIFHMVNSKLKMTNPKIIRTMYNFYTPSAKCNLHTDMESEKAFSILYNFHDNDGGTFFEKENKIYLSKESQALVFKSNLQHKGIAPKKYAGRLNLNLVCVNETDIKEL